MLNRLLTTVPINQFKWSYDMPHLGPTELIIILVIVLVLFGVGRIGKIAGEMGSGIRAFKEGLQGDEEKKSKDEEVEKPKDA
jgi:sec-independent protein translocase protein TatA